MTNAARLTWAIALIFAGTIGALFLPLLLCCLCDIGAGVVVAIGPARG